jgi:hypothetical protein
MELHAKQGQSKALKYEIRQLKAKVVKTAEEADND